MHLLGEFVFQVRDSLGVVAIHPVLKVFTDIHVPTLARMLNALQLLASNLR